MARKTTVQAITTARSSRYAYIEDRQRRYLITMGVRVVFFLSAILLPVNGIVRVLLIVASLVMPWVAVIVANGEQPPPKAPGAMRPLDLPALESARPSGPRPDTTAVGRVEAARRAERP